MYRLTPRMVQRLTRDLKAYHGLFDGGRCSGWELEELIVNAVKSDTQAQHQVLWKEKGHDDEADITIRTNGDRHPIQIKSGSFTGTPKHLVLSGHRLGRFNGDLDEIGSYLNNPIANILSVPYRQLDGDYGRRHIYRLCYVDMSVMTGLVPEGWRQHGKQWVQVNGVGVEFSLRPSMSWQIWWKIPLSAVSFLSDEIDIG